MYQNSSEKLREVRELHDRHKKVIVFDEDGNEPSKTSSIRSISHKLRAMKLCLDKWRLYIQHFETLCEDKSIPSTDKSKLKGYLKDWRKPLIPVLFALFSNLLENFGTPLLRYKLIKWLLIWRIRRTSAMVL